MEDPFVVCKEALVHGNGLEAFAHLYEFFEDVVVKCGEDRAGQGGFYPVNFTRCAVVTSSYL